MAIMLRVLLLVFIVAGCSTQTKKQRQQRLATEKQCSDGNAAKCTELGKMYEVGKKVKKNKKIALKLFEKACAGGDDDGCLGFVALNKSKKASVNYKKYFNEYRRACNRGYSRACGAQGYIYLFGKGIKKNVPMAIKLLDKACSKGAVHRCYILGKMYYLGRDVRKDSRKVKKYLKKACKLGSEAGCSLLKK